MSLPLLKQAIIEELPLFGIEHVAVSLFESNFGSPLVPFLVMKDRQLVAVDGEAFPPQLLAPQAFFDTNNCLNSVVVPLTFEGESIGVTVFGDHAHPSAYGVIRHQIGSAIQVATLHRSMVTQVEARERLEQTRVSEEARVAAQIQTTMSPTTGEVVGFELSHISIPAAEAGGDYYDIIPVAQGNWLTIGDVTGHGLGAGFIMLMLQSVIAGLVRNQQEIKPSRVISVVNEVIFDNVRHRLKRDEHATLLALHCSPSGQVTHAGAHEPIIVYRASTGRCEIMMTSGIWVGVLADATALTDDNSFTLEEGDVLVLVTDGLTEARNAHHEQFGLTRVVSVVEEASGQPVAAIRDKILAALKAWSVTQEDDVTLLIARYRAPQKS
jgi:serine phosphatase RsbU (regulator of sigma subunit)